MNVKLKYTFLSFIGVSFAAVTAALLIPATPTLPLFSLYLALVIGVQCLNLAPAAFMLTAFTTIFGVFCMTRVPQEEAMALPLLILALFVTVFLVNTISQRLRSQSHEELDREAEAQKDMQGMSKEIQFYDARLKELTQGAERRRLLSKVARELGALLDTQAIQKKLLETAQSLFPTVPVSISYGQRNDPVDNFVVQRRQSVLVPQGPFKGNPLMAVPISAQGAVAGILRVGGGESLGFRREDLRLLEILASLASLALDNSVLFAQAEQTALRDGLTGLITHRAFQDQLEAQILEASRFGQPLSLILADVDHFKSVNDTHGHQMGDLVLQGFAHVLVRHVRDVDIVSRYGGEEFVLLLLQMPHEEALRVAENIRTDLMAQEFEAGHKRIRITGSFGVATFPADATSGQQLIRKADERLYACKNGGRNQVRGRMGRVG